MRRIALLATLIAAAAASLAAVAGAEDSHTYKIEMYNAFGIVEGSDVRVAGVNSGTVRDLEINENKRAVVTVELDGDLAQLGEETTCSTEPQSLIAEYFIDCQPSGPPMPENGTVPASRVSQTVQNDLVNSTLREPFNRRLGLLINEFGTALAGNPDNLNEAIRLGAPALTQFRKVTKILGEQNAIIRDLNVNSDEVIGRLTERQEDVVKFVQEARDTAAASAERRDDLSRDFELLDDFLAELEPTLAELENVAVEGTPLFEDLRAAAPGLTTLSKNLPPFNRASTRAIDTLGDAGVVGRRALRRGRDEIKQLAESGKKAPRTTEMLADLLSDLDDPRRSVEIDDRVPADTGRTNPQAGQPDTKGYTGFESILNYAYYQTLAINQFDRVGHTLHINLSEVFTGPCGAFHSGRDHDTGEPGVPAEGGGTTTNILEAARCIAWLGPNQPGITDLLDGELPQYHPSVCPDGTAPAAAEQQLCDDDPNTNSAQVNASARDGRSGSAASARKIADRAASAAASRVADGPQQTVPDDVVDRILDLPKRSLDGLRGQVGGKNQRKRRKDRDGKRVDERLGELTRTAPKGNGAVGELTRGAGQAAQDLLNFLFEN
jgi:virulence factor Mce-like protein